MAFWMKLFAQQVGIEGLNVLRAIFGNEDAMVAVGFFDQAIDFVIETDLDLGAAQIGENG